MHREIEVGHPAMERLRDGRFDTRVAANGTDEIGALTEGFNLTAGRLAESYAALEATNRELAAAMDRILLLEQMKRALDRFVPETARREIEAHPDAPQLDKTTRDVSVLFLDIEGYAALSERLPRAALNDIVERYFSRFLVPIRAEAGEVNEIAGDGLMIIFGAGRPDEHAAAAVMTGARHPRADRDRQSGEGRCPARDRGEATAQPADRSSWTRPRPSACVSGSCSAAWASSRSRTSPAPWPCGKLTELPDESLGPGRRCRRPAAGGHRPRSGVGVRGHAHPPAAPHSRVLAVAGRAESLLRARLAAARVLGGHLDGRDPSLHRRCAGLTPSTDALIVKSIIGYRFNFFGGR